MLERLRFRSWWQRPRIASQPLEDRTVSFLELFYDLVYVVLIAELAHTLATHVNPTGIGTFVFLFFAVWWAWFNGTIYHDIHGNNDIRTRVFTFLQMFCVAAMAVFAHNATDEGAIGFALSYAAFNLVLTYLWWRTGVHDENHRPIAQPYSGAYLLSALLFIVSVLVPAPWRFYLWGLSLLISLLQPVYILILGRSDSRVQNEIDRTFAVSHSGAERFGLFNIIVLGEVIVGVVQGLAEHHHLTWLVGGTAALGMLIGIGLWWLYFDLIAYRLPRSSQGTTVSWMYLHLPLTISIAAVGAAVLNVIEHAGEPLLEDVRWLLVGAIAIALFAVTLLSLTIQLPDTQRWLYRAARWVLFVASLVCVALGFTSLDTIPLLLYLILLILAPIFYGIFLWVKLFDAQDLVSY